MCLNDAQTIVQGSCDQQQRQPHTTTIKRKRREKLVSFKLKYHFRYTTKYEKKVLHT